MSGAKSETDGCLFHHTVYTVDASNYRYQFIGYPFDFSPGPTPPTITFRIRSYDNSVYVLDPKTNHVTNLQLFRKFPKLSGAGPSALPSNKLKKKRRDWMTANVSAVEPKFLSPLTFKVISLAGSTLPYCAEDLITFTYTVQTEGKTYAFAWGHRNALDVTIQGANEFALGKKGSAYLIDDTGKERKVWLLATRKSP